MTVAPAEFTPIGDSAVLVSFADAISDTAHAQVVALDRALGSDPPAGMTETVPALVNLLVAFDVTETDHADISAHIRGLLPGLQAQGIAGAQQRVPVCYEGDCAPDLAAVADATGLSPEAVIAAHLEGDYRVLMYGFAPGYAYMAGVPAAIQVPRKPAPVRDVPAGSVIIAGPQCLVTTLKMPTGWSIIGRSPARILRDDPDKPFLFDVGDHIRFERIDLATHHRLSAEAEHG